MWEATINKNCALNYKSDLKFEYLIFKKKKFFKYLKYVFFLFATITKSFFFNNNKKKLMCSYFGPFKKVGTKRSILLIKV